MSKDKYFGESPIKDSPSTKLRIVIKDDSITTSKLKDNAVTKEKLADGVISMSKLDNDLANILSLSSFHVSKFQVASSLDDLPDTPNDIGWIVDNHLYLYTGDETQPYVDCGELRGAQGVQGAKGDQGAAGTNGKSAYEIWASQSANLGKSMQDYLESMQGTKGDKGEKGDKGDKGDKLTLSDLTQEELNTLKGDKGEKGDKGATGLGIANIEQTVISNADAGVNIITITRTDGETFAFEYRNGSKGSTGSRGVQGDQGEKGDKGDKGDKGARGDQGEPGEKGDKGDRGEKGDQGEKGEKGDTGEQGIQGETGPQGVAGPQGTSGVADVSDKKLINDAVTGGETDFLSAEVGKLGIIEYDVSKGGTVTFANVKDAINSVPTTFQKGGLTILFLQSNSLTYQKYTLKNRDWSYSEEDWAVSALGLAQEEGDSISTAISQDAFTKMMKNKVDVSSVEDTLSEEEGKIPSSVAVAKALEEYKAQGVTYMGVATIDTTVETPTSKVFYMPISNGTYENFGGLSVHDEFCFFYWNGEEWRKHSPDVNGYILNVKNQADANRDNIDKVNTSIDTINENIDTMNETITKLDDKVGEIDIPTLVNLTEEEYNSLDEISSDTYYMISEE